LEEEEIQAFVGHTAGKAITCLALNLSATTLVSGGDDNQVCVWDVGRQALLQHSLHNFHKIYIYFTSNETLTGVAANPRPP